MEFWIRRNESLRRAGVKFCSRRCFAAARVLTPWAVFRQYTREPTASGCILWTGSVGNNGYGTIQCGRRRHQVKAHRFAFELAYGPIPDGMHVLHRCDTPACVNPLHLFIGTRADNAADMTAKGRQVKGEESHYAKLTAEQVIAIRTRYQAGGVTHKQLAEEYGVGVGGIIAVLRRRSWKHLP